MTDGPSPSAAPPTPRASAPTPPPPSPTTSAAGAPPSAPTAGVDDEVGSNGSVTFQVLADGVKVAGSGTVTGAGGAVHLDAPLTGAYELTLEVGAADNGNTYDHADWAAPQLTCV
ncbi:NPCBM/NEW2 domain-containing protein [Kitasatospora arboriphila]